jgi:hypothetical protein
MPCIATKVKVYGAAPCTASRVKVGGAAASFFTGDKRGLIVIIIIEIIGYSPFV